jgi:hypothetical protein
MRNTSTQASLFLSDGLVGALRRRAADFGGLLRVGVGAQ